MKQVTATLVLRLLTREQKEFCAASCEDLLQTAINDLDFLKK